MSAKLSSLRKRLATLEQEQADRVRREELADCNCPEMKPPLGRSTAMARQLDDKNHSEKRPVSIRKVEANRRNALKSTGPKTLIGKAFSERNAIKHGLFARHFMDFGAHMEDPAEYEELLNGLHDTHQPVGRGEELEVELI